MFIVNIYKCIVRFTECLQNTVISIYQSVDSSQQSLWDVPFISCFSETDLWCLNVRLEEWFFCWLIIGAKGCSTVGVIDTFTLWQSCNFATCCHLARVQCQPCWRWANPQTWQPDLHAETADVLDAQAHLGSIWKCLTHAKLIKTV